jgi:MoaA/NifB/PqqE/SkfB family radical SAM enzyme
MGHNDRKGPFPFFHKGWTLAYHRLRFMFGWGRYLLHRRQFPLFRIFPYKAGALYTAKIVHDIGIQKLVQFGDKYFSSLTLPHHPSTAFDRMLGNGGLNVGAAGTALKPQIDTLLMAVTRECDLHCQHCYERHNIGHGNEIPLERLKQIVAQAQNHGVSTLVFTGGEPMNRFEDLLDIVKSSDKNLSDIHVHTSGHGATVERVAALKEAGLTSAAVGLESPDRASHDRLRGYDGAFDEAVQALSLFREAGILPYVNICATPELIRSGDLWRYAHLVRDLGVAFIQLLEPRPCGGYLNAPSDVLLSKDDHEQLVQFFKKINSQIQYRDYPIVHYVAYAESPTQRGCMMGGLSHMYIDSRGNVDPCVFLPVTFGNIMEEDFETIYARMRKAIPRPLRAECPSLQLHATLRRQQAEDAGMPVPFSLVEQEWRRMFEPDR